ncbi:alpha/beta hydrolase [Candidatus Poribacteria bacterium]|nr:alpha/beta hydrolase [Candidatus Poribacteria bacterium]
MGDLDSKNDKSQAVKWGRGRFLFAICATALLVAIALTGRTMIDDFIERNFVFYPERSLAYSPREWGMEYQDLYFTTPDGVRLNAWLIKPSRDAPMVLWYHGNAGNIADRVENARLLYDRGLSIFLLEYRGYGKSEGAPSEKGIYIDGQAAYDYIISQKITVADRLIIFGRSLGTTVATHVASRNKSAGVILESAITNMADMARVHYPVIPGLGNLKHKFSSIDRIAAIKSPILFIHGDDDEIVPYELGRQLFEAATADKDFYTIRGARHNDTYVVGGKEYFDRFEKFVREKTRTINDE